MVILRIEGSIFRKNIGNGYAWIFNLFFLNWRIFCIKMEIVFIQVELF